MGNLAADWLHFSSLNICLMCFFPWLLRQKSLRTNSPWSCLKKKVLNQTSSKLGKKKYDSYCKINWHQMANQDQNVLSKFFSAVTCFYEELISWKLEILCFVKTSLKFCSLLSHVSLIFLPSFIPLAPLLLISPWYPLIKYGTDSLSLTHITQGRKDWMK